MASAFGFGKATFLGRLTKDVELRTTPNGKSVCNFDLAFDRNVGAEKDPKAEFPHFVAWNKTAEVLATYAKKGTPLVVEGVYTSRKYTRDGEEKAREFVEFEVSSFHFCESKKSDNAAPAANPAPAAPASSNGPSVDDFAELDGDDGDLPF